MEERKNQIRLSCSNTIKSTWKFSLAKPRKAGQHSVSPQFFKSVQKMLRKNIKFACAECKSTAVPKTACISHLEGQYREAGKEKVFPILPQTQNRTSLLFDKCNPLFQTQLIWSCKFCMNTCRTCKPAIHPGKEQHYTHSLLVHLSLNIRVGDGSAPRDTQVHIDSQIYFGPHQKIDLVM